MAATARERTAAKRDRQRRRVVQFNGIEVSETAVDEIAREGYPLVQSQDRREAAIELSRFLDDVVACLDRKE